jgi:Na+/melibiose symporter-like transporter
LLALVLVEILLGNVSNYGLLVLTFIIAFPAIGAAVGLAQAALIDANPADGARTMTRWTMLSSVGDFLCPLLIVAFVSVHLGWTSLCWFAAALWLAAVVLLSGWRVPVMEASESASEAGEQTSFRVHLLQALRDPLLIRWVMLSLIPNMLDEVFLGFVALYLRDVWHMSEALIALLLTLQMLASFLGLFLLDRLLKHRPVKPVPLLAVLALGTLLGVVGLLFTHLPWLIIASLCLISLSCAGWYPLAQAEAYARRPGHSSLVRTVISLSEPLEMLLPGVVGLISSRFGLLNGLLFLGLAPVLMLVLLPYRQPD